PVTPPTTPPTTPTTLTPPTTTPTEVLGVVATRVPQRPTLPRTGSSTTLLGIVGVAAVGIGLVLAARSPRRRPSLDA
ncbi:MAG: LPXTG cell wall anchor domain-containing protein, partial [Acidimicrobiia bacterium]|nr:LPXTG cell wall anchor domain-containing protein [Acidimicrobiia bacterium]